MNVQFGKYISLMNTGNIYLLYKDFFCLNTDNGKPVFYYFLSTWLDIQSEHSLILFTIFTLGRVSGSSKTLLDQCFTSVIEVLLRCYSAISTALLTPHTSQQSWIGWNFPTFIPLSCSTASVDDYIANSKAPYAPYTACYWRANPLGVHNLCSCREIVQLSNSACDVRDGQDCYPDPPLCQVTSL